MTIALQAGLLIGSALGIAATVAGRRAERVARQGLVEHRPAVERTAIARLARAPGTLTAEELRAVEPDYAAAMERIVPALSTALGTELPGVVERSQVVDRAGWVRANTGAFASLIGKLEADLLDQVMPPGGGLAKASLALANRWLTTRQLGFLLGFMGQRVLGQYDLALLSTEAAPGRLLFVEENIRGTAKALGVPVGPFRTWIALHETTHAFEFEAHPWLRPFLASRLERQLTLFGADARGMGREAIRGLGRMLRGERDGGHWMEQLTAAAPLSSDMNSRRLMLNMGLPSQVPRPILPAKGAERRRFCRILSLHLEGQPALRAARADLCPNRGEPGHGAVSTA